MELLKGLELIEVNYENDNKKAVLTFLDEERGEVREINFNLQDYDNDSKKFIDSDDKAEKVAKWCTDIFGLTFNTLSQAIGEKKDIYAYEKFNSFFEVSQIEKFGDDMIGQIFETVVTEVIDDGIAIRIRFVEDDNTYESKMSYSNYQESLKRFLVNPQKKQKQYEKFVEKFQIPIENMQELVGKIVMVEVKKAMGKWVYSEIKPFPKKKAAKK